MTEHALVTIGQATVDCRTAYDFAGGMIIGGLAIMLWTRYVQKASWGSAIMWILGGIISMVIKGWSWPPSTWWLR